MLPIREDTDRLTVYMEPRYGPMVYWWPKRTYIDPSIRQLLTLHRPYVTVEVSNGVAEYIVEEVDGENGLLLCNLVRYEPLIPAG